MRNFAQARTNMVDSQIRTMGVTSPGLLEAYRTIPRERFVPESGQAHAYLDEDLPLGDDRWLMEPSSHARLLQAAQVEAGDKVLDIGDASGYSAAILSELCTKVVALESDEARIKAAQAVWKDLGVAATIEPVCGDLATGAAAHGIFDVIVVNGAVAEIAPEWIAALAPGGRMAVIVRTADDRIGRARLVSKNAQGVLSERILFDAAVPYLPGFAPVSGFVF